MTTSSSHSFLFLWMFLLLPVIASGLHPIRYFPHPWVFYLDENTILPKPWIVVDDQNLTETLANTTGFRIVSAILQQVPLTRLIVVDEIFVEQNGTKLFIPNCDGLAIYLPRLENEDEILENNPGLINHLRSGERKALDFLVKKVRFDGGGNVSLSIPFLYSNVEGTAVVHGVDEHGFGAMETEIRKLGVYPPIPYMDDSIADKRGFTIRGVNGFYSLEYLRREHEEEFINKSEMKIEIVLVASIVPTPQRNEPGSWLEFCIMTEGWENAMARVAREDMPYKITMVYDLYF